MFSYLFENKGKAAAYEYIDVIQEEINSRKGYETATKFAQSVCDENGNIDNNLMSKAIANFQGTLNGIENYGEGLEYVFAEKGTMSANQYEQMYIMQAISDKEYSFFKVSFISSQLCFIKSIFFSVSNLYT